MLLRRWYKICRFCIKRVRFELLSDCQLLKDSSLQGQHNSADPFKYTKLQVWTYAVLSLSFDARVGQRVQQMALSYLLDTRDIQGRNFRVRCPEGDPYSLCADIETQFIHFVTGNTRMSVLPLIPNLAPYKTITTWYFMHVCTCLFVLFNDAFITSDYTTQYGY